MTAIGLFALLAGPPLPTAPPAIDYVTFSFSTHIVGLGPSGTLTVWADGKVGYSYQSAPSTGSGGHVVQKNWTIPKDEAAKVLAALVKDGLLDWPEAKDAKFPKYTVWVSCGRWGTSANLEVMPENLLRHLRPYLEHAHPELWKAKAAQPRNRFPNDRELTSVKWIYTPKDRKYDGTPHRQITVTVTREGRVKYVAEEWTTSHNLPDGVPVTEEWTIPAADAEKLLAGLADDGLLDSKKIVGGSAAYPRFWWEATSGRWKCADNSNENLEKIIARLRPVLEKADPDMWKTK